MMSKQPDCMAVVNQPSADQMIEQIRRELAARGDVACAYVFGSRATGKAEEGSDYDSGVVTTATPSGKCLMDQIGIATTRWITFPLSAFSGGPGRLCSPIG